MTRNGLTDGADVAGEATGKPLSAKDWSIAAGMLQFPSVTPSGQPMSDASTAEWRETLLALRYEGFDEVELSNRWVDITKLSKPRLDDLVSVLKEIEIAVPGYLVAGASVVGGTHQAIDYTLASIEAAASIGAKVVCLGLHSAVLHPSADWEWFWNAETARTGNGDLRQRQEVVATYRKFAERAEDLGLQVSVEMYPGTYVGTAQGAIDFVREVGHPALGINPDLGNLVRVQGTVENWEAVAEQTLPFTNYWHVKSYSRSEVPGTGAIVTHPTSLELGVINYRKLLDRAVEVGFSGTIVAEHYGGDGLAVSAANREYLRRLLRSTLREPLGQNDR